MRYKWTEHKIKFFHVCLYLWVQEFDPLLIRYASLA